MIVLKIALIVYIILILYGIKKIFLTYNEKYHIKQHNKNVLLPKILTAKQKTKINNELLKQHIDFYFDLNYFDVVFIHIINSRFYIRIDYVSNYSDITGIKNYNGLVYTIKYSDDRYCAKFINIRDCIEYYKKNARLIFKQIEIKNKKEKFELDFI